MAEKTDIQAPWVVWAKEVEALFEYDPDVSVEWDGGTPQVTLRVCGADKAESVSEVMPDEVTFGNVSVPIEVVPDNEGELTPADHLRRAFAGNPALVDVVEAAPYRDMPPLAYALFAPECVQIECDNAASPYGVRTLTYEDIARDVLGIKGVLISSDLADD